MSPVIGSFDAATVTDRVEGTISVGPGTRSGAAGDASVEVGGVGIGVSVGVPGVELSVHPADNTSPATIRSNITECFAFMVYHTKIFYLSLSDILAVALF